MNKANIGWWEADLKAETYKCSELISQLLGIGEDGLISFEDFNKRILKEDQGYATFPSFDKVQQTVEEIYLFDTPKGHVWIRSKACFQETDENGNTKVYGIAETQEGIHIASAHQALQNSERILHNIYKNLPVGIELYDKDGQMVDLNKKDMEMFRISNKEDILGVNIFENPILPEEIKQKIKDVTTHIREVTLSINSYNSYQLLSAGFTDTYERFSLHLRNTTVPFTNANNVWSFPIPTFSPG